MSSDPITYTVQRLQIIDNKINELPEIFNEPGSTYTELKTTRLIVFSETREDLQNLLQFR